MNTKPKNKQKEAQRLKQKSPPFSLPGPQHKQQQQFSLAQGIKQTKEGTLANEIKKSHWHIPIKHFIGPSKQSLRNTSETATK